MTTYIYCDWSFRPMLTWRPIYWDTPNATAVRFQYS